MQSGSNDIPPPTAPTFNPFSIGNNDNSNDVLNRLSQEQRDELLARRLQEEENTAAPSRRGQTRATNNSQPIIVQATTVPYPETVNNTSAYPDYRYANNVNIPTTSSNMPSIPDSNDEQKKEQMKTDAEIARKVEREMNDEIYARQLQEYERRRGAARVHVQPTLRSNNNRSNNNGSGNRQVRSGGQGWYVSNIQS